MKEQMFEKLFYELINAGRDMALRDSLGNAYLSEELYLKDVKARYLQPMNSKSITDEIYTRENILEILNGATSIKDAITIINEGFDGDQ